MALFTAGSTTTSLCLTFIPPVADIQTTAKKRREGGKKAKKGREEEEGKKERRKDERNKEDMTIRTSV